MIGSKVHAQPELAFENQALTSFAGWVIFQKFFTAMQLKKTLHACFAHMSGGRIFGRSTLFIHLILHLLLGYRELKDCRFYKDDPLVKRVLGLNRLPDAATLSRLLKEADEKSVENLMDIDHKTV